MTLDEKLDVQIAAQEAGDNEAALEAASIPDAPEDLPYEGDGLPPVEPSSERAAAVSPHPASEVPDPVDVDGDPDVNEDQPEPEKEKEAPKRHPLLEEGYNLTLVRMSNGEWALGQMRVQTATNADGHAIGQFIDYYKVFAVGLSKNAAGETVVQMRPWPMMRGDIEISSVSAKGYIDSPWDGVDMQEAYVRAISPILRANAKAMEQAQRQKLNASRILQGVERTR